MSQVYLSARDSKGRVRTFNPAELPADAPAHVVAAAQALLASQQPKRGRGRPAGYKCSADTVARMAASQRARWAAARAG